MFVFLRKFTNYSKHFGYEYHTNNTLIFITSDDNTERLDSR